MRIVLVRQAAIEVKYAATQIDLVPTDKAFPHLEKVRGAIIFLLEIAVSIGLPMAGLLIYMAYAEANGIKLEVGCHGPGVPFSMLSGILYALILRIKCNRMGN